MNMQKEVLSIFPLPLKNRIRTFQKRIILWKKYLDKNKGKIRGVFWVTVILRSINLPFLSLLIWTKFDQFVQFVTLFELNMHVNSILDDHCFIYSTLYLKNTLKLGVTGCSWTCWSQQFEQQLKVFGSHPSIIKHWDKDCLKNDKLLALSVVTLCC